MILSRRRYTKSDCVTFKSTKGEYGGLSNMAPNFPVFINDIHINNVELLYQSFRFPDFPEIQSNILSYKSPISAKHYARRYLMKTRSDWNIQRFKIMRFCIHLKYYYNPENFGELLLRTGSKPIVEFTYKDKIWGATDDGESYEGTNALGRLLMELRENIKNRNFTLQIPDIVDLSLVGKIIDETSLK